jgi:TP901 family phage tail tape measure protein
MGKGADLIIRIATAGTNLARKQLAGLGKTGTTLNAQMKTLSKIGVAGLGVALIATAKAVSVAVSAFKEFDSKMTQSLAIMNTTVAEQEAMVKAAQQVAMETTISANQSAEAFFFLASAGLDAEQSIAALPQVAKFAQAGMFDMATATDLATDAQSALGLTVKDAEQNLANLTRVTDVLVKGNTLANASVQQFSEALTTKAGAALKVVNKDIEEGVAVLAVFADRGVKGAEAGDKLNQVLRDIPRATAKNSEEFAKLGLEMFDAEGNMKNVADIIEELDAVLGPMSDEMKAATLDQLGLNRGVADAVKILSGTTDQIREYEKALRDAGGTTQEISDNQLDTLQAELDILSNKWQILLQDIGKDFEGTARGTVSILDKLVQAIINARQASEDFENGMPITRLQEYQTQIGYTNVTATRFVTVIRDLEKSHDAERDAVEAYNASLEDLRPTQEEVTEQIEEQTKAELELAQARKDQALGALQDVLSAYKRLQKIQDNIADLTEKEKNKTDKLNDALADKAKAEGLVDKALEELKKQQELSTQVTLDEEIAIERAKEALARAEEQAGTSKLADLELEKAKRTLEQTIIDSTTATQAEIQAQREVERAKKQVAEETERVKQAQKEYQKAQEDLAKATEENAENLLEMAIAKKELDKAIADANAIGALEEGLQQMVSSVGGSLDELAKKFGSIFDLAGKNINMGSVVTGATSGAGSQVFPASGGASVSRDIGGGLAERTLGGGNTVITVNTGTSLSTATEVEEAVARALQEGARRGINVII